VEEGGPADKADIRPGDIILSVDGRPVEGNSLPSMISVLKPGTTAELEIWRDKKLRKATPRLVELSPSAEGAVPASLRGDRQSGATPPAEEAPLGLTVRLLTADEKRAIDTDGSLVVEGVEGPAAAAELRAGDIILDVAGTPVKSVAELQSLLKSRQSRFVPLRIQRGNQIAYQVLRKPQ
jgi:serine protease Do